MDRDRQFDAFGPGLFGECLALCDGEAVAQLPLAASPTPAWRH
jgi:hypothetical protein